ncbi:hypothetical protein QU487_22500, partial [Crenobacter sp. SG2305]|uniref:hypothetical protein n=1 Tax=Crenobacter oryzisoli TaxID=3056844 RepID=UPI0025AAA38F
QSRLSHLSVVRAVKERLLLTASLRGVAGSAAEEANYTPRPRRRQHLPAEKMRKTGKPEQNHNQAIDNK